MYATNPESLGETIRQLRRKRCLTQTDLGGDHFSKSYVSAIERDKIAPSYEALHFFAEQLEQPLDYFENLYEEAERAKRVEMRKDVQNGTQYGIQPDTQHLSHESQATSVYANGDGRAQENFLLLLDTVLEQVELSPAFPQRIPLTDDVTQFITMLPSPFQGRFAYLIGLHGMQQENLPVSMEALEQALTLAPVQYQPAILDALGMNHYVQKDYHTALNYHLRALHLLEKDESTLSTPLGLKVYFHCGNAARSLGAYEQSRDYYEMAHRLLSPTTDMHTTGQLLHHLGYTLYAQAYQILNTSIAQEKLERIFQRAIGFLVQSRTLYHIAEDRVHETQARLTHSSVLLDMSTWERLLAQEKAEHTGTFPRTTNSTFLNEAEEQNRQVLLTWLQSSTIVHETAPTAELEVYLYSAMSNLIHVYCHRAVLAELSGYTDTARRERALAIHYCQQLLNALTEQEFPWSLVYRMATSQHNDVRYQSQSLPHLPTGSSSRQILSQAATYYAAAKVAELFGRSATHPDFIYDAYTRSDECIHLSLDKLQCAYTQKLMDMDISYVVRTYQRCIKMLEEREKVAETQGIKVDGTLRSILKDGLQKLTLPRL